MEAGFTNSRLSTVLEERKEQVDFSCVCMAVNLLVSYSSAENSAGGMVFVCVRVRACVPVCKCPERRERSLVSTRVV